MFLLPCTQFSLILLSFSKKDYKTGKKHGEFWLEIPNKKFKNKKNFYSYLKDWLFNGQREILMQSNDADHNFVFNCMACSKPLHSKAAGAVVTAAFKNKTGLEMGPHKLRHIFRSYVNTLDISIAEHESIAFCMQHTLETARNFYSIETIEEKVDKALNLVKKIDT